MAPLPPVRVEVLVDEAAARRPDHIALVYAGRRWSYAQLRDETYRRATTLMCTGLAPGDVVATAERVTDDTAIAFLACCRADLVFFPLTANSSQAELAPLLARVHPQVVLTRDGRPHPAAPDIPALPLGLPGAAVGRRSRVDSPASGTADATALIRTTSGTTGAAPKLVRTPHRTLTWLRAAPLWWRTPAAVHYFPYPTLFAVRGVCDALWDGATIVLSQATEPRRIEAEMATYGVTALGTVPALVGVLAAQDRPSPAGLALAIMRTVAATLPHNVQEAAERRYHATIVQEYSSTEAGAMMGTPQGGAPMGSIGKPYPGVAARIVDEGGAEVPVGEVGELVIRSPGLMLGYLDDSNATAQALRDGWLWSGDLARRDADGYYFLAGRRTLRINVGGFKVAPEEVEAVLEAHPAVHAAVVLASADAARGEVVRAVIVPRGEQPGVDELRRWCRARLAAYKVPRVWEFREELPRSPLGKVLRHLL